jgi:hypothetical protein
MFTPSQIIAGRREKVIQSYNAAMADNHSRFMEGDEKATAEYVFENQRVDANNIVRDYYENNRRVISISKKTKVGMDGLMIEVAKLMTTHPDDNFVVNPDNVRIITGMSNIGWEKDMKDKSPPCFKESIFHHGQLKHTNMKDLKNALIIIDEIDSGSKENQVLHTTLKEAGILDTEHMKENNNRFMFASATMLKELYDLYRWGPLHEHYKMTIPPSYIGHTDFLEKGIIQEFYPLNTQALAEKWIQEDIKTNYGKDFRIHIARVSPKTAGVLQDACIRQRIGFRNHTSDERLSPEEIRELFQEPLVNHIVIAVKGFFRRANLIPNRWKLRIGAVHEMYTKAVDNNVQIQGLPGRMSGYWRDVIEGGHKTGPYRTSIKAVQQYEMTFNDPFGPNSYKSAGFKKDVGKVSATPTMISPKNIVGLVAGDLPDTADETIDINKYRIYSDENITRSICEMLYNDYKFRQLTFNDDGFAITSTHSKASVLSLDEAIKQVPKSYGLATEDDKEGRGKRIYFPCYENTADKNTIRFVVILHPDVSEEDVAKIDAKFPSIAY